MRGPLVERAEKLRAQGIAAVGLERFDRAVGVLCTLEAAAADVELRKDLSEEELVKVLPLLNQSMLCERALDALNEMAELVSP